MGKGSRDRFKIGFTGTRYGMTGHQVSELRKLLVALSPKEFHHGDCIGADVEAHVLAESVPEKHVHPPTNPLKRAFCPGFKIYQPKPYLERNHDIVNMSDILIAAPMTYEEELRSGTWATVRYARKQGKRVIILKP